MAESAQEWYEEPKTHSLSDKEIPKVDILKTLEDPIFGTLYLGRFTFLGDTEAQYTYIKRLDPSKPVDPQRLWRLATHSQKHPDHGYIPKLLAYSTHGEHIRGYLDRVDSQNLLRNDMIGGEREDLMMRFSQGQIRELYFEPFPENLRMQLLRRAKDRIPYNESELWLFITSAIRTLKQLKDNSLSHPMIALESFVPMPSTFYMYHPFMYSEHQSAYSRINSGSKHYCAPEEVELIVECNSMEEYTSVREDINTSTACLFGVALVALELATLVEEEEWYNEDVNLKKDIIWIKLNMVKEHYSWRLFEVLSDMLSPAKVRPDVEGMIKLTKVEREESKHYQQLLEMKISDDAKNAERYKNQHDFQPEASQGRVSNMPQETGFNDIVAEDVSEVNSQQMGRFINKPHPVQNRHFERLLQEREYSENNGVGQSEDEDEFEEPQLSTTTLDRPKKMKSSKVVIRRTPTKEPVRLFDPDLFLTRSKPERREPNPENWPLVHESLSRSQERRNEEQRSKETTPVKDQTRPTDNIQPAQSVYLPSRNETPSKNDPLPPQPNPYARVALSPERLFATQQPYNVQANSTPAFEQKSYLTPYYGQPQNYRLLMPSVQSAAQFVPNSNNQTIQAMQPRFDPTNGNRSVSFQGSQTYFNNQSSNTAGVIQPTPTIQGTMGSTQPQQYQGYFSTGSNNVASSGNYPTFSTFNGQSNPIQQDSNMPSNRNYSTYSTTAPLSTPQNMNTPQTAFFPVQQPAMPSDTSQSPRHMSFGEGLLAPPARAPYNSNLNGLSPRNSPTPRTDPQPPTDTQPNSTPAAPLTPAPSQANQNQISNLTQLPLSPLHALYNGRESFGVDLKPPPLQKTTSEMISASSLNGAQTNKSPNLVNVKTYRVINGVRTLVSDEMRPPGDVSPRNPPRDVSPRNPPQTSDNDNTGRSAFTPATFLPPMQQAGTFLISTPGRPLQDPSFNEIKPPQVSSFKPVTTSQTEQKAAEDAKLMFEKLGFESMINARNGNESPRRPERQETANFGDKSFQQPSIGEGFNINRGTNLQDQQRLVPLAQPSTRPLYQPSPSPIHQQVQDNYLSAREPPLATVQVQERIYEPQYTQGQPYVLSGQSGTPQYTIDRRYQRPEPIITAMGDSRVHSLPFLSRVCHSPTRQSIDANGDFYRVAKEIKDKLDELIDREKQPKTADNVDGNRNERLLLPAGPARAQNITPPKSRSPGPRVRWDHATDDRAPREDLGDYAGLVDLSEVCCCVECKRVHSNVRNSQNRCRLYKKLMNEGSNSRSASRSPSPMSAMTRATRDDDCKTADGICPTQRRLFAGTAMTPIACPKIKQKSRSPSPNTEPHHGKLRKIRDDLKKAKERRLREKENQDFERHKFFTAETATPSKPSETKTSARRFKEKYENMDRSRANSKVGRNVA